MPDDLTQISWVGFGSGLPACKQPSKNEKSTGPAEAEIAAALFDKLKVRNYIPNQAREEYKQAFLREYKKAIGEPVTEDQGGLVVKILGPGCPSCDRLEQTVMAVLAELDLPADIEHIRDLKEILALGIFGTPALMINNELKATGLVPSRDRLKTWLQEAAANKP